MAKIGKEVRRFITEGTPGEAAQRADTVSKKVREHVQLTEDEACSLSTHRESLAEKSKAAEELDIMELWEELVGPVRQTCWSEQDWNQTKRRFAVAERKAEMGVKLEEAEVMSNQFQLLTQAKLYTTMMATYELTKAVFEAIFSTFDSPFKTYKHQIPSDAPTVEYVPERGEYTEAPLGDRYCETKANKFGRIVAITRETIITDRTGQVVQQAKALAESAKYREDELAAVAFRDASNSSYISDASEQDAGSYYPAGTQTALYRATAGTTAYTKNINMISAGATSYLTDWSQVANAVQLLMKMVNNQSQYIETMGDTLSIVVPVVLAQRANLLIKAVQARIGPYATSGDNNIMLAPDPLKQLGVANINVVVWKHLPAAGTVANSIWYLAGMSKKQCVRHSRWNVEFNEATPAQLGGDDFRKDVIFKVRAGFNTGFRVIDDKYVIKMAG